MGCRTSDSAGSDLCKSFPRGTVVKNPSACQCRRHEFDPWVEKIPWRRKWQPTPVYLPGKFHGLRRLVGYSSWGCKESDTTELLHFTSLHFLFLLSKFEKTK